MDKEVLKLFIAFLIAFYSIIFVICCGGQMYSMTKKGCSKFVSFLILPLRIKNNLQQGSAEWQKQTRQFIQKGEQRIEQRKNQILESGLSCLNPFSMQYEYLEMIRIHNSFVREYQIAILRYLHGSQYSSIKENLWEILPKEI